MSDEKDAEIKQLKRRLDVIESYLNQFESYKKHLAGKQKRTEPSKPAKKVQSSRGSRLSEDWIPSEDLLLWASKEFPEVDLKMETDKFVDYWLSRAGSGAVKLSWSRTFRNWIRNSAPMYRRQRETHQRHKQDTYSESVRSAFD